MIVNMIAFLLGTGSLSYANQAAENALLREAPTYIAATDNTDTELFRLQRSKLARLGFTARSQSVEVTLDREEENCEDFSGKNDCQTFFFRYTEVHQNGSGRTVRLVLTGEATIRRMDHFVIHIERVGTELRF